MKINKKQRDELFNKYNGKCAYCGCKLPKRWHADHIEPIYRDWKWTGQKWNSPIKITGVERPNLDVFENLNPSCAECNIKKGASSIEVFREELSLQVDRLLRDSNNFKFALKYKQIKITKTPIVFYFEKFNEQI